MDRFVRLFVLISERLSKAPERKRNMALFKRKSKEDGQKLKSVLNTPQLDLRHSIPSAIAKVKTLNAALVILPKEPSEELMAAYGAIPRKNVATELYLERDAELKAVNGCSVIECMPGSDKIVYELNGIGVVLNHTEETPRIVINGVLIFSKGTKVDVLSANGLTAQPDFEIENTKLFPGTVSLDRSFFENIKENTVVACGRVMAIELDVTPEVLQGRNLFLAAGGEIKCSKRLLGVLQTMSVAGGKYEISL